MKKRFLFMCALWLVITPLSAFDFEVNGIYYNIIDEFNKQVEVTGESNENHILNYSGNISIPSNVTYNGADYSVVAIGSLAFVNCTELTSVTIPNSVTEIGWNAFWGCTGLTEIAIPDGVTTIPAQIFWGCTNLTSVTIPNNITKINTGAFSIVFITIEQPKLIRNIRV